MSLRPRMLMRLLRIVVACLALGIVAAPVSVAVARGASIAWVVQAPGTEASRAPRLASRALRQGTSRATTHAAALHAIARRPPGARTVVVQRRVYLRLASLLC